MGSFGAEGLACAILAKVEGICVLSRATGDGSGCEFVRDKDARPDVV